MAAPTRKEKKNARQRERYSRKQAEKKAREAGLDNTNIKIAGLAAAFARKVGKGPKEAIEFADYYIERPPGRYKNLWYEFWLDWLKGRLSTETEGPIDPCRADQELARLVGHTPGVMAMLMLEGLRGLRLEGVQGL